MNSNSSKLFEGRNKLADLEQFRKYLQKNQFSREDYEHLYKHGFEKYRQKFIKIAQIFKIQSKNSFLDVKLKDNPVLYQLSKSGNIQEFQAILKIQNVKTIDPERKKQLIFAALQNTVRKNDRVQSFQIIKFLFSDEPKPNISPYFKALVSEALERQQFQAAQFILKEGTEINLEPQDRDQLIGILGKYSSKKNEQVSVIRQLINQKATYDWKSQTNGKKTKGEQNYRVKGRSEQGLELDRNRANEYRQKADYSPAMRVDSKEELYRLADNCFEKKTKQKQKQLHQKQKQLQRREKQKKQKINKRVFTPDELKQFLDEEIKLFMQQIERENFQQKSNLNELIEKITAKIKENVSACVKIFGSFATQLCLFQSDIDMVVLPTEQKEIQSSFVLLQSIANLLQSMTQQVQTVKYIKTASIPIIKIQCTKKYDSKKIDITYKDQNHNGLDSVELIQKYLGIYPQLRSLVFVLKKFIYCTNIYDPYSGGLSSYGLILMIVAYLQNQNRERKLHGGPNSLKSPSIAELLIGFLNFYGFKCNYISKQICVLTPDKAKQEMEATNNLQKIIEHPIYVDAMDIQLMMYPNDWQPRAKLMIVDPLNLNNNIGRATHKIREIKTAFEMAYVCIHTNKNCEHKKKCESYQRMKSLNLKDTKCENYKRPCCIIKRMLNSTKSFMAI